MMKTLTTSLLLGTTLLSGCAIKLLQPHDAQLYQSTEQFYKQAATLLLKGERSSPANLPQLDVTPTEQARQHPGHYSHFQADYDSLLIESNALILRSLANSGQISGTGKQIHAQAERLLSRKLSSECDKRQRDFPDADLATRNYIDLQCLVSKWQNDHARSRAQILSALTWQTRQQTLFNGILAIQSAETSKQHPTGEK